MIHAPATPTPDEKKRGLDLAMSTFPAGWERDSLARRAALAFAEERVRLLAPPTLVRISIEYAGDSPRQPVVREFTDVAEADDFLVADSYVTESYVKKLTWERLA